jgi:hypothetical protein
VIRRALSKDLPDLLIALDRWASVRERSWEAKDLAKHEAAIRDAEARALGPEVRAALGEGAARRLGELVAAARAAHGERGDAASDALLAAVGALDDELAAAGLGHFVDGDVITDGRTGRRMVIVYAFSVEQVNLFDAAGVGALRALHLRRIDKLNWSHTLLGFTRPHLREAVVLLDQLDEQVLTLVAPGLVPGASVALFDPEALAAERAAVEARAGKLVRDEYGDAPGLDAAAARRLGELLGRRRALFEGWEKQFSARGLGLVAPSKLRLDDSYNRLLAPYVQRGELDELLAIDTKLAGQAEGDAFVALRDFLVASIERHEAQHRIDYGKRRPGVMPKVLEAWVGPLESGGRERRHAAAARGELSAYLGELARDARTTRVNLTMVSRFLFDRRLSGTPECYAALVIVEGLVDALSVSQGARFVDRGVIDRGAVAKAYLDLASLPADRIRLAARRLWEKLFEEPLPELRLARPRGP